MSKSYHAQGSGLIELLISIVILSFGIIALATLNISIHQHQKKSYLRSISLLQMSNMAERIRANKTAANAGLYNGSGIPTASTCTTCSSTEMAQNHMNSWNTGNDTLLPSGQGVVQSSGDIHTITIHWDQERTGATGLNCSTDKSQDLNCDAIGVRL